MVRYSFRERPFPPKARPVLEKIARFTPEETRQIISLLSSVDFFADWRKEQKKFSDGLGDRISAITPRETGQLFDSIVGVLRDLSRAEFDEDIVEDSLSIEDFSDEHKKALFSLLREIHKSTNYYDMAKVRNYKYTGPDILQGFDWAVDFRGVFKKGYQLDENIVDYGPKIEDLVPMVILEFAGSTPFNMSTFQVDEEDLDKLINQLLAAQKQLIAMKKAWEEKNV